MNKFNRNNIARFSFSEAVSERIAYLKIIKVQAGKQLQKAPKGKISVVRQGQNGRFKYYNRENSSDKYGKYLNKSDMQLCQNLAQKKYNEMILAAIEDEIAQLERIVSICHKDSVIDTYSELNPGLSRMVSPYNIDDRTLERIWLEQPYESLGFNEADESEFYSDRGERMRSKSEVLIANALLRKGIAYKYECPLELSNGKRRYPDFTILCTRMRKIYYWEHLGKIGDADYAENNLKKMCEYMKNGLVLGGNLIMTCESASIPLGTREINQVIDSVFGNKI